MKAREVQDYLQSLKGEWEYPVDTVDTFKAGDPEAEVLGIAVAWMSSLEALRQAVALGCNLFVTHEPTYFNHRDEPSTFHLQAVREKQRYIAQNGLTVLRCHDLWDQLPGLGIPDSWGAALGLGQAAAGDAHSRVYELAPRTALEVAQAVAGCVRAYGQQAVQLVGPPSRMVRRLSLGTGAITPYIKWVEHYDIDLAIVTDDGINYWREGAYAMEFDIPLVVVNHPVSELAGVQRLAETLQARFAPLSVKYLAQGCQYQLVTGGM